MESNSNNPNQRDEKNDENYSVDEIMSRLKRNDRQKRSSDPSKDGELVTRNDGSQVVKVRKRKRRSSQPEKKKKQRATTNYFPSCKQMARFELEFAASIRKDLKKLTRRK